MAPWVDADTRNCKGRIANVTHAHAHAHTHARTCGSLVASMTSTVSCLSPKLPMNTATGVSASTPGAGANPDNT